MGWKCFGSVGPGQGSVDLFGCPTGLGCPVWLSHRVGLSCLVVPHVGCPLRQPNRVGLSCQLGSPTPHQPTSQSAHKGVSDATREGLFFNVRCEKTSHHTWEIKLPRGHSPPHPTPPHPKSQLRVPVCVLTFRVVSRLPHRGGGAVYLCPSSAESRSRSHFAPTRT